MNARKIFDWLVGSQAVPLKELADLLRIEAEIRALQPEQALERLLEAAREGRVSGENLATREVFARVRSAVLQEKLERIESHLAAGSPERAEALFGELEQLSLNSSEARDLALDLQGWTEARTLSAEGAFAEAASKLGPIARRREWPVLDGELNRCQQNAHTLADLLCEAKQAAAGDPEHCQQLCQQILELAPESQEALTLLRQVAPPAPERLKSGLPDSGNFLMTLHEI